MPFVASESHREDTAVFVYELNHRPTEPELKKLLKRLRDIEEVDDCELIEGTNRLRLYILPEHMSIEERTAVLHRITTRIAELGFDDRPKRVQPPGAGCTF
jgi:hypothetical protein